MSVPVSREEWLPQARETIVDMGKNIAEHGIVGSGDVVVVGNYSCNVIIPGDMQDYIGCCVYATAGVGAGGATPALALAAGRPSPLTSACGHSREI